MMKGKAQREFTCARRDHNKPGDDSLDGADARRLSEEDGVEDCPRQHAGGGANVGLQEETS